MTEARMRASDLARPFRGVRVAEAPSTRRAQLEAAAARLSPWQALAGSSAAELLGYPLPPRLSRSDAAVIVATTRGRSQPRSARFTGIRITQDRFATLVLDGVRVTDSVTTWCLLARELGPYDLVAVGDALISTSQNTPRRCAPVPHEHLVERLAAWRGSRGIHDIRSALTLIRPGVESRMETVMRLTITDAGFPEPVVHPAVRLRNGVIVHPDLAYPYLQLGFEYEGLGHGDPHQVIRDIARYEALADAGWAIIRITKHDLASRQRDLMRRIHTQIDVQRRLLNR